MMVTSTHREQQFVMRDDDSLENAPGIWPEVIRFWPRQ